MVDNIVNTPGRSDDSSASWALAILVLVAILIAGFFLFRGVSTPAVPNTGDSATDINVTVPTAFPDVGAGGTGGTEGTGGPDENMSN